MIDLVWFINNLVFTSFKSSTSSAFLTKGKEAEVSKVVCDTALTDVVCTCPLPPVT